MSIAWGSLLAVCVVSLAVGVAIVVLVAFALVGLSARAAVPAGGPDDGAQTLSPAAGSADRGRVPARRRRDRRLRPLDHHRLSPCRGTRVGIPSGLRYGARHDRGRTRALRRRGSRWHEVRLPARLLPRRHRGPHPHPDRSGPGGDAGRGRRVLRRLDRRPRPWASRRSAPSSCGPATRTTATSPPPPSPAGATPTSSARSGRRWACRSASTPTSRAPRSARAAGVRRRGCRPSST